MFTLINAIRRNQLDLLLWLLFGVSFMLMLIASEDPMADFIERGSWLERFFTQFATGNQIIFDVFVGVMVSLFMYVLVVRLPAWQKKKRLKANLLRHYDRMKADVITYCLFASEGSASCDLQQELMDQLKFKAFFDEWVLNDQRRWHVVLNSLTQEHVKDILTSLGLFRTELEYTLMAVDADDLAFNALRNLNAILQRSRTWGHGYDEIKPLTNFIWTMCTGWDLVHGYQGNDIIASQIDAI